MDSSNNEINDSIPSRIDFVNNVFKNKLVPLIDTQLKNNNVCDNIKFLSNIPTYDMNKIFNKLDCKLTYTNNTKTNIYFKGIINNDRKVNLKISLRKKSECRDFIQSENTDISISSLLKKLVIEKQTPHIALPISAFYVNIDPIINLDYNYHNSGKYIEFINEYNTNNYCDTCLVFINEYSNRGTLLSFIKTNFRNLRIEHWTTIFFQIISVLAVIQSKYSTFRHNNFTPQTIMVHKHTNKFGNFKYKVCHDSYLVYNIGYKIKIYDFDNAHISYNSNFAINRYCDLRYFFCSLISRDCCPEILTNPNVPIQIKDFINRIIPEKCRNLHNNNDDEFLIPNDILNNDPLFEDFRNLYLEEVYINIYKLINKTKNNYNIYHHVSSDIYRILFKRKHELKQILNIYWCLKNINDPNLWLPNDVFMEILQFVFIKIIEKIP